MEGGWGEKRGSKEIDGEKECDREGEEEGKREKDQARRLHSPHLENEGKRQDV